MRLEVFDGSATAAVTMVLPTAASVPVTTRTLT
jgi:hypothetical protein